MGFRTFVLQGGEAPAVKDEGMVETVAAIRQSFPDCAITLSLGEKSREAYERFFLAGANRYLLRHETCNEGHYHRLHPAEMSLSHREAALLLECDEPGLVERIFHLAREIKQKFYGNRIVMFAPLYLSNYCVNGCVYCPYHAKNRTIPRKKLSQEEIRREVVALQDMGHKRLALEAGEDPRNNPIDYILESIRTIYSIHHKTEPSAG